MRRRILVCIAGCFYYSGLVALARWWTRRDPARLVILIYHRAEGGDLRRHMRYLRRHYRIMHLEAALEELYAPRKAARLVTDRRTPLVLTFDDGYSDNYTYGFKLAKELEVPYSIYIIPEYVESGDHFWWLEGKRLSRRTQLAEVTFEERTYHPQNAEERQALEFWIDGKLRYATTVVERQTILNTIRETLQVPANVLPEDEPAMPISWEQVREMDQSGLVSFGAHTMNHHVLAYLSDPAEVKYEVAECREVIEQKLGHPVRSLAYPVGQRQHIRAEVFEAMRESHYDWGVSTNYGINTPQSDPYLLQRMEADIDQHWLVVAAEAAGLWGIFAQLRWIPFVRKYFTNSRVQVR